MMVSLKDVEEMTDCNSIQEMFLSLRQQEEKVTRDLDELLKNQAHLETKMRNLNQTLPQVAVVEKGCNTLHNTIRNTNLLAEKVSRKVRQLDTAKGRVDGCIKRVNDIIDLIKCCEGVQETLASDDYELAASHIQKYLLIDQQLISSIDADVDGSFLVLREAELRFINNLNRSFDRGVKEGSEEEVMRFAKLYPMVGRAEEGLAKLGNYLARKVAGKGQAHLASALKTSKEDKRWSVMYADTLTRLFEDTARVVEGVLPLVEECYGEGSVERILCCIQDECIRQARATFTNFLQTRNVIDIASAINNGEQLEQDIKLDQILEEMVIMNSRSQLYTNFIRKRIQVEEWTGEVGLHELQQEAMGHYILLETNFMKQGIQKAVSLERKEEKSLVSSVVDDTCYVIQKSVQRAISSKNVDTTCAMINNAASILSVDVCKVLLDVIKAGYPASSSYSWSQQGTEEQMKEQREAFLTAVNNTRTITENILKLAKGFEAKCEKNFTEEVMKKVQSCLSGLRDVQSDFREVLRKGEVSLCKVAVYSKLHPVVAEVASTSHVLTEDAFLSLQLEDPWLQEVVKMFGEVVVPLESLLHTDIYHSVVATSISEMTEYLEKLVMTCSFGQLGGLLLERRLRSLATYLSSLSRWSAREQFARLNHIALLLSAEHLSEVTELFSSSSPLSIQDVRKCLKLRTDFRREEIEKIVKEL